MVIPPSRRLSMSLKRFCASGSASELVGSSNTTIRGSIPTAAAIWTSCSCAVESSFIGLVTSRLTPILLSRRSARRSISAMSTITVSLRG